MIPSILQSFLVHYSRSHDDMALDLLGVGMLDDSAVMRYTINPHFDILARSWMLKLLHLRMH